MSRKHAPMERDKWTVYYRHTIEPVARRIAGSIIEDARALEGPVVWITGNSYMPPGRSIIEAEQVWQSRMNDDGEAYAALWEEVERHLSDGNVILECPEWDNALYAVDLARWQYREDGESSDDLNGEWEEITS